MGWCFDRGGWRLYLLMRHRAVPYQRKPKSVDAVESDICRRCLLPGSFGLLSLSAWKVTRRAAEGGVRLWCRAPADLLDPRGSWGVRGECCPVAPSGARCLPGAGRTAGVGSVLERMGAPLGGVICVGSASGWCVLPA